MKRKINSKNPDSNKALNYREFIYKNYAEKKYLSEKRFDAEKARKWAFSMKVKIGKFLPADKNARILDAGCGGGQLLFMLKEMSYKNLEGVDLSPDQVALAKQICNRVTRGNILLHLKRVNVKYDLVFAFDVIEHLNKREFIEFLKLCNKRISQNGTLILMTPNMESPWGAMHRYHDFTHEIGFDPASLDHMLGISGFRVLELIESGPVIHGLVSFIRWTIWKILKLFLYIWNLAETGTIGSGIYTRVFICVAQKVRS